MDIIYSILSVLLGVFLRLAIPITLTAILIYFLRKLDAHWQAEAITMPLEINKPNCWQIKGCSPEQIRNCAAAASPLPCWQFYRQENGYLREECLDCRVFRDAPIPV